MVSTLAASERTGVAIARALREDPDYPHCLLVLDEPTATLPVDEVDNLLDRVAAIAALGVGVLYVTHHLGEVFRVAQKVSVFRDGKVVGAGPVVRLRPCLDRPSARRRGAARRGERDPAQQGRACGGPQARDGVRDLRSPRRRGDRHIDRGRARRDRRDRGTGRLRPRHRARRGLRLAAARRRRGQGGGQAAAGVASRCRHRPRRGVPRAGPQDRRGRHDHERAREPHAAGPQAVLEGRDRAPEGREGADQRVVRAAGGASCEGHGGAAQHLQRRQPAEDPVREMAVPEADGLPAGRADPGRRRRRQERPPQGAGHRGPGRRGGC